jgi:aerobic carbon-monoxide dehydrogenase small subunit
MWERREAAAMTSVSLSVNGKLVSAEVDARMLLAEFLRNELRLTGTHVGCDTSQCGCCVVHVNGASVKSCTMLAVAAQDAEVVTIEGFSADDGGLHHLQAAFREHHALQCGYCTPGVIMSAAELLHYHPQPSEKEIRKWLEGNLCRCTGYHNIVRAVQSAVAPPRE